MESILTSIKKLLGITEEQTSFDSDIIMHINTVFSILTQLGVGPSTGVFISDDSDTWDELIPEGANLELVKTYVYMKVRLMFDPPSSSAAMEAVNKNISELEWRINTMVETPSWSSQNEGEELK